MKPRDIPAVKEALLRKLADRSATIGIVGLGYVGLPLALRFAEAGYAVIGFDIDPQKVAALNAGRSYIGHIPAESVAAARKRRFEATGDYS
ncbi:MAG: NAD(P)-binding domain-containing protein, partial [Burkholderiales bacterium]